MSKLCLRIKRVLDIVDKLFKKFCSYFEKPKRTVILLGRKQLSNIDADQGFTINKIFSFIEDSFSEEG